MEDYYDRFLQLCVVIPQQPNDIYFCEAFRKGLQTKVKMAIISMSRRILVEVSESTITMENKLPMKQKNITRYHQANPNNEELYEEDEGHHKTKKKDTKVQFDTIKKVFIARTIIMDTSTKNVNSQINYVKYVKAMNIIQIIA